MGFEQECDKAVKQGSVEKLEHAISLATGNIDPKRMTAYRAILYFFKKDYGKAAELFSKARIFQRERLFYALSLIGSGKPDSAISYLKKKREGIKEKKELAIYDLTLAIAYYIKGDIPHEIEWCKRAVEDDKRTVRELFENKIMEAEEIDGRLRVVMMKFVSSL